MRLHSSCWSRVDSEGELIHRRRRNRNRNRRLSAVIHPERGIIDIIDILSASGSLDHPHLAIVQAVDRDRLPIFDITCSPLPTQILQT
jgi:hypothetical protein